MANQSAPSPEPVPFQVKDCALITLSTGKKAQNLRELRDRLHEVPAGSIYHHFWGRLLRSQFDEPEYNNDFASWAYRGLHDKPLAEQLSMVLPTDFDDLECLRREVVEVVEQRLDEIEQGPWSRADQQFYFLQSQLVVFDTGLRADTPEQLAAIIPSLSTGSIYYHFIDARRRTDDREDDFNAWIKWLGPAYGDMADCLRHIDPYFASLKELRLLIQRIFERYCKEKP